MDMTHLLVHFAEDCQVRNYSPRTVADRREQITLFIRWCAERDIVTAQQVTRPLIERYQRHLHHYRKRDGNPLSVQTQAMRLVAVRVFFKWLAKHHHVLYNPAAEIELPKSPKQLPKHVLSAPEAEAVINQPDTTTRLGLRDRAILEVLYSTGMRRQELARLKLPDLGLEGGTVMIRGGKGNKDRVVPIGERASAWLIKYLEDVRPELALIPDTGEVFLLHTRKPLTVHWLSALVRKYIRQAEIGKTGSCHLLRHSMATLMLENGADIRYIQAILGHEDLATTQIYTQVSIAKLKEVHKRTHPARLERRGEVETP
jgi:integrase/recombinase XerD